MHKNFKKLLISIFAGVVLFLSIVPPSPVIAQTPTIAPGSSTNGTWYNPSFPSFYAKVYNGSNPNEIFGERYTAAQVSWVFWGFLSMVVNMVLSIGGCSPQNLSAFFAGNASKFACTATSYLPKPSNLGKTKGGNMISEIFADRPFSGVTYFKNIGQNLHIVPQAKAASTGFGYGALDPIRTLWQATRNISYILFVVVILIMAFMIMFRVKISPQVVVSIQSALPKIAIGLVLVTFSYAIAGFLIDLMYVVIGLLSILFASTNLLVPSVGTGAVGLFHDLTMGFGNSGIFGFLLLYFAQFLTSFLIVSLGLVVGIVGSIVGGGGFIGVVAGGLVGAALLALAIFITILLFVVLFVILLWMSVKILITLIRAFAYVMFLAIILPLQITLGIVMPSVGFGTWLRQFVSNLAVFPITGALFLLAFIFMEVGRQIAENGSKVSLNLLGNVVKIPAAQYGNAGWPPLLGISPDGTALLFLIASFFIVSLVPKAAEVASALITGKGNFGNAIGEAVGPVRGLAGGYAAERLQRYQNINRNRTPFQNAQRVGRNATVEYGVLEAIRRATGGR